MKILVVDDDPLGRELLRMHLKEYGICDLACNGREALDAFHKARQSDTPYDLISLDVEMPLVDGKQVLSEIRETERDGKHTSCVFIITAHESPELAEKISGANDFISKPFSANLLKRLLESHHLLGSEVSGKRQALIVSVSPETRAAITNSLQTEKVALIECTSFLEAEQIALSQPICAVVADIPTIIKSKGDEQLVASSLQNIFPFIRVKARGALVMPITNISDIGNPNITSHFETICSRFVPRCLRAYKRYKTIVPVVIHRNHGPSCQSVTLDISWGGAFVILNGTVDFDAGNELTLDMPTLTISVKAVVVRTNSWGKHGIAPGLGLRWTSEMDSILSEGLSKVLGVDRSNDRDRLLG